MTAQSRIAWFSASAMVFSVFASQTIKGQSILVLRDLMAMSQMGNWAALPPPFECRGLFLPNAWSGIGSVSPKSFAFFPYILLGIKPLAKWGFSAISRLSMSS